MRPEQRFYPLLRPHLPGFAERIENAAGAGNPDFACIWQGKVFHVEVKIAKTIKWELKKLLEPSQIAWATRYWQHGGIVFFVVKEDRNGTVHLYSDFTTCLGSFPAPVTWKVFQEKIILRLMLDSDNET